VRILNLTRHPATPEQKAAGVVDFSEEGRRQFSRLLTFDELPSSDEIWQRALLIASSAKRDDPEAAMIGGAPFLMAPLEKALRMVGITPLYAFSRREAVEETLPDGSVKKTQVFRHLGFVEAVR